MHFIILRKIGGLVLLLSLAAVSLNFAQMPDLDRGKPSMPDISLSRGSGRGNDPLDKLSPSLRMLYEQFTAGRGRGRSGEGVGGFTDAQLSETFGIKSGETDPLMTLAVTFASKKD